MDASRAGRLALTAVLALYGFRLLLHPEAGSLMDSVDLPIHETGHLVFAPFGEFLQFLGGTLFQLIMPSAFVVYFARRRDPHAASVALWWVAQNFWNISVYVADARSEILPLVGGGEHDWAFLLAQTRLAEVRPRDRARCVVPRGPCVHRRRSSAASSYCANAPATAGRSPSGATPIEPR